MRKGFWMTIIKRLGFDSSAEFSEVERDEAVTENRIRSIEARREKVIGKLSRSANEIENASGQVVRMLQSVHNHIR